MQSAGALAGGWTEMMDMPEFAADLHEEVAAALAELDRLRGEGDEEGVRAYEVRLANLRRIAANNGIDLSAPTASAPGLCPGGKDFADDSAA